MFIGVCFSVCIADGDSCNGPNEVCDATGCVCDSGFVRSEDDGSCVPGVYYIQLSISESRSLLRLLISQGAVVSDDGSKLEILSRIAQATAAVKNLKPIWRDNNISLGSKVKLMRSLVISIFLYACESWTLTAELEKRTQAFEMRCYRRL